MKKSDIALLIVIVSISAVAAYWGATLVFGNPKEHSEDVFTAERIDVSEPMTPSPYVFYDGAINPSVRVEIEGDDDGDDNGSLNDIDDVPTDG